MGITEWTDDVFMPLNSAVTVKLKNTNKRRRKKEEKERGGGSIELFLEGCDKVSETALL